MNLNDICNTFMLVLFCLPWGVITALLALFLPRTPGAPGAVGSHLCCGTRGAAGVRCLAQGHFSRGIEGGESAVHSLLPPSIPDDPRFEPATFG